MHLGPADTKRIAGGFSVIKEPLGPDVPGQQDPAVVARVSAMLSDIEKGGLEAVRRYAEELDGFSGDSFEVTPNQVETAVANLPADLREALDAGASRTRRFAETQRSHLTDFEAEVIPGVVCGQKYVPVRTVGAYLPAGRFPLLASAFMTVGVARAAGVPNVVCCTPPARNGRPHPAVLYAARASGAEAIYVLGGVQALAAMAFGLLDGEPADMIVGAGNAYVAEAKRQLFGRVGIDVLAGPSEVAVIADDSADATTVAADLLAQAEHGPSSPACLVTTSDRLAAGFRPKSIGSFRAWRRVTSREPPGGTTARSIWPTRHRLPSRSWTCSPPSTWRSWPRTSTSTSTPCTTTARCFWGPGRPSRTPTRVCRAPTTHCRPPAMRGSPADCRCRGTSSSSPISEPPRRPRRRRPGTWSPSPTSRACRAIATAHSAGWISPLHLLRTSSARLPRLEV